MPERLRSQPPLIRADYTSSLSATVVMYLKISFGSSIVDYCAVLVKFSPKRTLLSTKIPIWREIRKIIPSMLAHSTHFWKIVDPITTCDAARRKQKSRRSVIRPLN
jgi:hypothetical protein